MRPRSLWWVPAVAFAAVVAAFDTHADGGDLPFFLDAARTLLSENWVNAFSNPAVQSGPLQLAALGSADAVAGALSISTLTLLAFAIEAGAAALLLVAVARTVPRARGALLGTAGLVAVALGLPHGAFVDGHPAQLVIPLAWLVAAREARAGRGVVAGAIIGLCGGLELWGVLGAAVVVLAPRLRTIAAALATEAAVAGALFVPFLVAGNFRMLDYRWRVADGTLVSLVVQPGDAFPWDLRLLQGAAAIGVGAALAYALRRSRHGAWVALSGLVVVRLALDPVLYSWYWLALQTLLLAGAVEVASSTPVRDVLRDRLWKSRTVPIETP